MTAIFALLGVVGVLVALGVGFALMILVIQWAVDTADDQAARREAARDRDR